MELWNKMRDKALSDCYISSRSAINNRLNIMMPLLREKTDTRRLKSPEQALIWKNLAGISLISGKATH
jgi:hypothetical protein